MYVIISLLPDRCRCPDLAPLNKLQILLN
jgi:hypothetical protein